MIKKAPIDRNVERLKELSVIDSRYATSCRKRRLAIKERLQAMVISLIACATRPTEARAQHFYILDKNCDNLFNEAFIILRTGFPLFIIAI